MSDESTSMGSTPSSARPLSDVTATDEMAWAMVDASPDALVMVNDDGVIELLNEQAEVLFGYDRVELLGRPVEILLPPELSLRHRGHRTRYRAAPEMRAMGEDLQLWARHADGSDIPVEISLSPIELGGRTLVLGAVRDISARRAAEAEMRRLQRAVDSVGDGVAMIDPESLRFVYANRGMTELTGFDATDLTTMTPLHFSPTFTRADVEGMVGQLLDGAMDQVRMETTLRPRSGVDFPVEAVLECPAVERGQPRVVVLLVHDISERIAAEEQALLIQHTIDAVTDAVFMCDETTLAFNYVNQGAVDLHGYPRAELLNGMTPYDLAPDLSSDVIEAALDRLAVAPGESVRLRTLGQRRDGSRVPVDVAINWPEPAQHRGPRPVMAVVRDVTEQVEAETSLRDSEARFHAAFDEGPVPMAIVEVTPPDRRTMINVNQALAELFGYDREELIGRSGTTLVHPDDADSGQAEAIAGGADVDYARLIRGVHRDGRNIWLQRHVSALSPDEDRDKLIVHVLDETARIEADLSRYRQQALTAAMSEIRLRMLQGASRQEGLALLCKLAASLLDSAGAVVLTPTGDEDAVAVEASAGVPASAKERMHFRTTTGGVGEVFATGKTVTTPETRHATMPASNREVLDEHNVGPIMMAPLPSGDETVGVLAILRLVGDERFDDNDLEAAQQFAAAAAGAIELAQSRSNEAALELLQDRERIGRDMHDNVISKLFATGMRIQAIIGRSTDPDLDQRLTETVDSIDDAIKDIRTAIYGIRSRTEWGKGNRGLILALAADQNDIIGFEPNVRLEGPIDELPDPLIEDLLAVISEALTNTARYANASRVDMSITCGGSHLDVEVRDDGGGFDPDDQRDHGGHSGNGLENMRARAAAHGGDITINSQPGQGTTIRWSVPLDGR